MDGQCSLSPHRGHYWVEETPESDDWACRWCGLIRHFNRERIEKLQSSETEAGPVEYPPRQWFYQLWDGWSPGRLHRDPSDPGRLRRDPSDPDRSMIVHPWAV